MGTGEGTGLKDKEGDSAGDGTLVGWLDESTPCGDIGEAKFPRLLLVERETTDVGPTRPVTGVPD